MKKIISLIILIMLLIPEALLVWYMIGTNTVDIRLNCCSVILLSLIWNVLYFGIIKQEELK